MKELHPYFSSWFSISFEVAGWHGDIQFLFEGYLDVHILLIECIMISQIMVAFKLLSQFHMLLSIFPNMFFMLVQRWWVEAD